MGVRAANSDEFAEIMRILEGALLAVNGDVIRTAIQSNCVRVYVEDDRVLGVIVTKPAEVLSNDSVEEIDAGVHIDAIAVRPNRRDQGIGRELIQAILACYHSATVTFEERSKPFYEALNVSIISNEDDAYVGVLKVDEC